ncbi:MAG: amidohydrolase family protein, partial [Rikenellaceae bacterium]|nr:amidohydrolase family protein [Rikenellaceae bacterium]
QGLDGFIRNLDSVRENTCAVDRIAAASFRQSQMFAEGTSLVADICNDTYGVSLKCGSGVDYHNFVELFGLRDSDAAVNKIWAKGETVAELCLELGLEYTLTPHSTYSVSDRLMSRIAHEQCDMPVSVHFMEDSAELELFESRGALYERYHGAGWSTDFGECRTPVQRLIRHFSPDRPLLLVHNTCVREEDIDRINDYFTNVIWVLCPRSNQYISQSQPPIELLRKKGCRIALGTDSLASNSSLLMCDEVRFVLEHHSGVSLEEVVQWATTAGRTALKSLPTRPDAEAIFAGGAALIENVDWGNCTLTAESTSRRLI